MRHEIYWAYIQMALGLSFVYTNEMALADFAAMDRGEPVAHENYVWTGNPLADQICAARGISRLRFVRLLAAPKPSRVQHWVFCDEIKKHFNEDFGLGWPKGRGLIVPRFERRKIRTIEFVPLSTILRPKAIAGQ